MELAQLTIHCDKHGDRDTFRFGTREPRCPACVQEEIEERRKAQQLANEQYDRQQRAGEADEAVPLRYRGARFADFPTEAVEKVNAWLERAKTEPVSLMVFGPVGTGKTHLAACITRKAIISKISARYVSQANYLRQIRQTWGDDRMSEESVFSSFVSPRILVLDDIGAARGNDNDILRVGELIAERYDALRPSVFVTNLTPADLRSYVGDRSYDRMRDQAVQLVLNGETRRKAA